MSNDTENDQLNGCIVWAVAIVLAIAAAGFFVVRFIWEHV